MGGLSLDVRGVIFLPLETALAHGLWHAEPGDTQRAFGNVTRKELLLAEWPKASVAAGVTVIRFG